MRPEEVLYMTMVESGMKILPGTMQSLKEAIEDSHIYFFDKDGDLTGFVTWYFEEPNVLVMNNLCLWKSGFNKLFELRKMLHQKYPNLIKVKWWDTKHEKPFEAHFGEENEFLKDEYNSRPFGLAENRCG